MAKQQSTFVVKYLTGTGRVGKQSRRQLSEAHNPCFLSLTLRPVTHTHRPLPLFLSFIGIIRPILHLKGAQYSNEIVTLEDVAANRADYPFGHIPVLIETKPDGTKFELGESIAIEVQLHCSKLYMDMVHHHLTSIVILTLLFPLS